MKTLLPLIALLMVCGCGTSHRVGEVPSGAPLAITKDSRRQNHPAFSSRERDLIRMAERHIAQANKRPASASGDAYYRVRRTANGYEVFVRYVTGYEANQPVLEPCLHNAVLMRADGSLLRILTGPECWP